MKLAICDNEKIDLLHIKNRMWRILPQRNDYFFEIYT